MKARRFLWLAPLLVAIPFFYSEQRTSIQAEQLTIVPLPPVPREKGKKSEENIKRLQQENQKIMDPATGKVPVEQLMLAERQTSKMRAEGLRTNRTAALSWSSRGPNNMGGRTRAIIVDKKDATNNTVIAGSVGGGIWRTTNFKSATPTWTRMTSASANLSISCLAQDPSNHNIMYAGTGEGYNNYDNIRGLGIYKSTDAGITWNLISSTTTSGSNQYDFQHVQKILVYTNGDVYASGISTFCNFGGILKSVNGGTNWTRVIGSYNNNGFCTGAFDFLGYDIEKSLNGDLYASVMDISTDDTTVGKIFRSPAGATVGNAGTWTNVTAPPPAAQGSYWQRIELACSGTNNNTIYAIMQGVGVNVGGVAKSTNAGSSWTSIPVTSWCDMGTPYSDAGGIDFSRGQAWYDLAIAVKPNDDQTVLVGGVDLMKTTNGGATWTQNSQWLAGCGSMSSIHADQHNIFYLNNTSSEYIVVNDGGIYYTADNGATYSNKSAGYNTIQYYTAALHPASGSNYMLAGAQDNGTQVFENAGLGEGINVLGGDGTFCFIDRDNPQVQIAGYQNSNYIISRDGGYNFITRAEYGDLGRFINPADYDAAGNILFAGFATSNLLRVSNIAAGTPSAVAIGFASATNRMVSAIKVDTNVSNRVWVAFSTAEGSSGQVPQLYYVSNANGNTATATQVTVPAALPAGSYISSIDVESGNASHLLLTVSNYNVNSVWESMDAGATWTSVEGNLPNMPVRWGHFMPAGYSFTGKTAAVSGIMLATEVGVWTTNSVNGASTSWIPSSNLPNVRVDMIRIRPSDRTVVAATHGLGLYTSTIPTTLPIQLFQFAGKVEGTAGLLEWSTSAEQHARDFDVEKSNDGIRYTAIGTVKAVGNSIVRQDYSLRDLKLNEVNYYRLRMNDQNGQYRYSNVVQLRNAGAAQDMRVTNPFSDELRIDFVRRPAVVKLMLSYATGQVIARNEYRDGSEQINWRLPTRHLVPGVYVLRAEADGEVFIRKLIRQ